MSYASIICRVSFSLMVVSFCAMATAPAAAVHLSLETMTQEADLIAWVRVTDTAHDASAAPYEQLATLVVLRGLKGSEAGQEILLEFDTGCRCPNVVYAAGEEALLFMRATRPGRFAPLTSTASFPVSDDYVRRWAPRQPTKLLRVNKAFADIQRILRRGADVSR